MDTTLANIIKALAYTENGGKPDVKNLKAGKSGELKSMFQFTPDTWKIYSKAVSGQANLPLTPENEAQVVYHKVGDWYNNLKSEGVPDEEIPLKIASMWNAGEHKPDAYKQNVKGVNKYGVHFDTPAYAKKMDNYFKQFQSEGGTPDAGMKTTMQKSQGSAPVPLQPMQNTATLPQLAQVKQV